MPLPVSCPWFRTKQAAKIAKHRVIGIIIGEQYVRCEKVAERCDLYRESGQLALVYLGWLNFY